MTNTPKNKLTKNFADEPPHGEVCERRTNSALCNADGSAVSVMNIPPRKSLSRTRWRTGTPPSLALARYQASLA